ncbi:MAG: hypothetical protein IPM64_12875 [Phycisphaerales bacterium]|nr:hypothetical protein [Phycisphaerales bacterium]
MLGAAAAAAMVTWTMFTPALEDSIHGDSQNGLHYADAGPAAGLSDLEAAQLRDVLARVAWDVAGDAGLTAVADWLEKPGADSALAQSLLPWDESDDWDRANHERSGV